MYSENNKLEIQLRELDNKYNISRSAVIDIVGGLTQNRVDLLHSVITTITEHGATSNEIMKVLFGPAIDYDRSTLDPIANLIYKEKYPVEKLKEIAQMTLSLVRVG